MRLDEYRKEIDRIDRELVELLEQRLHIAERIAEWKKCEGLPIEDADREEEKLESIGAISEPELKEYNETVFRTIISVSKEHQSKMIKDGCGEEER